MPESTTPSSGILASIGAVFRQNRLPCVILNVMVIALVGSYYFVPSIAHLWESIGAFKTRWSFVFSLVSTIFAAVLMPSLAQAMLGTLPTKGRAKRIALQSMFWGYRGMEIDLFYRLQAWWFGTGNDGLTLLKKVTVDQFIASPVWFVPTYLIALRWIDHGGSWVITRASLNQEFWRHTFPMVLVTNWLVWIPALVLIYSLPSALQFPLFAVVMTFFILIVTLMARDQRAD